MKGDVVRKWTILIEERMREENGERMPQRRLIPSKLFSASRDLAGIIELANIIPNF